MVLGVVLTATLQTLTDYPFPLLVGLANDSTSQCAPFSLNDVDCFTACVVPVFLKEKKEKKRKTT